MRYVLAALFVVLVFFSPAEARTRHHGSCDGVHRCRCGTTQADHFRLPWSYNGFNLKQAREWLRAFRHVSTVAVGVVVYQRGGGPTGHVSRVTSYSGGCRATVSDDAGTYERDICKRGAVYLTIGG